MSFCADVKNELADLRPSGCCKPSLAYGFMLFGRSFSIKRISMQTVNKRMAEAYSDAVFAAYRIRPVITSGGKTRITYKAEVISEADRLKILASYDFGINPDIINREIFRRDCCPAAFLRGAFLACGAISDPESEYRAEFSVKSQRTADELLNLLSEHGIMMLRTVRGGNTIIYTKDSSMIEDLLTLLGASHRSLEIMDTKIIKSVKNNTNRASNCDTANISKTVEASINQRTAIEYLEKTDRLYSLPQELLTAALLRKENPNSNLKELCKLSPDALTVSGLNHRMKRIIEIYGDLKK